MEKTPTYKIIFVEGMPEVREPDAIYLDIGESRPERDQCLGAFLDAWSLLEARLLEILWELIGGDAVANSFQKAEAIFYAAQTIRGQVDPITGLISIMAPALLSDWQNFADDCLALSNARNQLVHGHWQPEFFLPGEKTPAVFMWARAYKTGNPEADSAKLALPGKQRGQNRYDIPRIKRKTIKVNDLTQRVRDFREQLKLQLAKSQQSASRTIEEK